MAFIGRVVSPIRPRARRVRGPGYGANVTINPQMRLAETLAKLGLLLFLFYFFHHLFAPLG